MENRFRETKQEPEVEKYPEENEKTPSFFSTLFSNDFLPKEKALALLPYFLFLAFLGVLYIANRHSSEAKTRALVEGEKKVKELKWEYIGLEAKWMLATKQSQVANQAATMGLKESTVPPFIIEIEK